MPLVFPSPSGASSTAISEQGVRGGCAAKGHNKLTRKSSIFAALKRTKWPPFIRRDLVEKVSWQSIKKVGASVGTSPTLVCEVNLCSGRQDTSPERP